MKNATSARPRLRARAAWAFILAAIALGAFGIEAVRFVSEGVVYRPDTDVPLAGEDAVTLLATLFGTGILFGGCGVYFRMRLRRTSRA